MKNNIPCLLVWLLFFPGFTFCQRFYEDSLRKELSIVQSDTQRVLILNKLSIALNGIKPDSAELLNNLAFKLAMDYNYSYGLASCFNTKGSNFYTSGNSDSAIFYLNKAIAYYRSYQDTSDCIISLLNLANVYRRIANWALVFENAERAVRLAESSRDSFNLISGYRLMGSVNRELKKYEKADDYYRQAISISTRLGEKQMRADTYVSLGILQKETGNFKEALSCYLTAYQLYGAVFHSDTSLFQAVVKENEGDVYVLMGLPDKALQSYKFAFDYFNSVGSDNDVAFELINMARIATLQNRYNEALIYLNRSEALIKTNNFNEYLPDLLSQFRETYEANNDWKNALRVTDELIKYRDSSAVENQKAELARLSEQYEADRKDQKIKILSAQAEQQRLESEKQKIQKYYSYGGISALLTVMVFVMIGNKRMNRLKMAAEKSEKFKQQFLAFMSHEIRSPMSTALGALELAENQADLSRTKQFVNIARKSSKDLLKIVNDILDLSKLESGKLEFTSEIFRLQDTLEELLIAHKLIANRKNICLDLVIAKELPKCIKSDPLRLRQIVNNLLNNAIRFTEKGKVTMSVEYVSDASEHKGSLLLEIADTGIGIEQEHFKQLFNQYIQSSPLLTRKYGGTGLGLVITRNLINLAGGSLVLESEPGKGTLVKILLPVDLPTEQEIYEFQVSEELDIQLNTYHDLELILCVADDNESGREITVNLMQGIFTKGTIHAFESGNKLLEFVKTFRSNKDIPICILLDLDMPDLNGFETLKIIREQLNLPVPVIALTASIFVFDSTSSEKGGFDDVVIKPFVPVDLAASVLTAIQK